MQHVLVVDEPSAGAEIKTLLTPRYRVSLAEDGERAVELLDRDGPDLVLLEAALPGMSGIELAAYVVQRGLPAVVISPKPAICAGLDRLGWPHLRKPFEVDALLHTVQQTLALAQQRQHVVRQSLRVFARTSGELREAILNLSELRQRVQETLARSRRQPGPRKPH
jgi:DNA-binding response OmpR family regulator